MNNSAAFDYKGWREQFILSVLRIASVLGVALILTSYQSSTSGARIFFISLYIILLTVTLLPMPYSIRAFSLVAITYLVGLNALLEWGPFIDGSLFLLTCVLLAALLFDTDLDVFALAISITTILVLAIFSQVNLFRPFSPNAPLPGLADWAIYGVDFSIPGIALVVAIGQLRKEFTRVIEQMQKTFRVLTSEKSTVENRVQERTEQLEAKTLQLRLTSNIARNVSEIQNIPDLLETVVNSTAEQFGYYHVGLYLLDERRINAFLQAASSIAGKQLIGQGFRVEPDRNNAINLVAEGKKPYIASESGGKVFIKDPNFPYTRSRMVLPLSVRGEVIGVLDMHSDEAQTFNTEDAQILQTMADLVAISIDNVRLIDETKALILQLESYTSTQTSETWSKFTRRHAPAYQYTPAGIRPIFSSSKQENSDESMIIPLILHGQGIGNIKLRRKGLAQSWTEKERELIEKIADQVSLALENSRLVDEAQKSAQRDQLITNISSRVRETLDVESVIRTAATELRKVFDLKEAEISIGTPQAEPAHIRKNTRSLR